MFLLPDLLSPHLLFMGNWKKTFAIIWSGQFMSILSSSIVGYAIMFWLSLETQSAEVLAISVVASLLPQGILSLFVGVYVDRWDRKTVMILADSFIAACTLLLAILFWLGIAEIWHIYILQACRSVGSAFHLPAMQASVPLLAPPSALSRIAGVNQMIRSSSEIAGPVLGAVLIGLTGIGNILVIDVVGAVLACTALAFVKIPNPEKKAEKENLKREMKEGFTAITSKKGMVPLFIFSTLSWFFFMPVAVIFPLITLQHFGGEAFEMSLVEISWGIGALLGGALIGLRTYRTNRISIVNIMYIILGAYFISSGLLPSNGFVAFCVLTGIGGASLSILNAMYITTLQLHIEPAILGRVMSLSFGLSVIPSITGLLGIGYIAEHIGITQTFVIAGIMNVLIGICSFMLPNMMKLGKPKE